MVIHELIFKSIYVNKLTESLSDGIKKRLLGVADGSRTHYLRSHNPVLYLMSYGHHLKMRRNIIDL